MKPFLLLIAVLTLLACGGGGILGDNIFAGRFQGNWANSDTNTDGTFDLTVNTAGQVSGTIHNNQLDKDGTVNGTITQDGRYDFLINIAGEAEIRTTGQVTIDENGRLVGTGDDGFSFDLLRI